MNTATWNTRDLTICLFRSDSKGIPFHFYITTLIQDECPLLSQSSKWHHFSGVDIRLRLTFLQLWITWEDVLVPVLAEDRGNYYM